jgi:hypothetical protein
MLDSFLLDAADRRRARGYKADGPGFGGAPAAAGPAAAAAGGGPSGAPAGGLFAGGYLQDGSNRLNAAAGAAMAGAGGGFGGYGGMGGGVGGVRGPLGQAGAPAAKRQRLWSAALYEEQRNNAIRCVGLAGMHAGQVWHQQHGPMDASAGAAEVASMQRLPACRGCQHAEVASMLTQ